MQSPNKTFAFIGRPLTLAAPLIWVSIAIGPSAHASGQAPAQATEGQAAMAAPVVPQQVRYAGKLANRGGDVVEAVFRIYAAAEGGEPLWTETQRVTVAEDGSYSVLLGGVSPSGLPQAVFAGGAARWLGVSVERAPEQERALLSSVPYAMKSADSESLAGHAASDFVTQAQLAALAAPAPVTPPAVEPNTSGTVTGSGTAGTVPLWTGALTQGNSEITQVGSDIGINQPVPAATLDVGGTENVNGVLSLPQLATATKTTGQRSQLIQLSASAWSSTTNAPVTPTFKLLTNFVANNSPNVSGQLELHYQQGTGSSSVLSIASNGVIAFAPAQTFPGTIKSVTATSPVTATTTSGSVALGLNQSTLVTNITPSLESTFNGVYAQLGAANTFTAPQQVNASGADTSGMDAVVTGNGSIGIYGESDGAINGSATPVGVEGLATSTDGNGMVAVETGLNGYGIYAHASGAHGSTTRSAPVGVYSLSENGNGVLGIANGSSGRYNAYIAAGYTGGAWGDTSALGSSQSLAGIVGSADDNDAGYFVNDSADSTTIFATNESSGGTGLFKTFKASTRAGTCGIGDGDLICTGQVKTLATTGGGAHTVETYAMQSPENWMEDFGTAELQLGVAVVKIDLAFAETVSDTTDYHVFITPNGDSRGLYVINKTAASFEVRESGGGTSSLSFDYRIVAKRRGYEAQRLNDVTERFNAEQARLKRRMPAAAAGVALPPGPQPELLPIPRTQALPHVPASRAIPVSQTGSATRP